MKIKRYQADSMRAALALVRSEQGTDAVILSSRRTDAGIEVIAAVDYDAALFAEAKRPRQSSAAGPATPTSPVTLISPAASDAAPASKSIASQISESAPIPTLRHVVSKEDPAYGAMHREIQDMRRILESGLADLAWAGKRNSDPLQTRVLEELTAMDIAPDVARAIAALAPKSTTLENPDHIPMALLCKQLRVVNDLTTVMGGVTALVGPTGAGKTTTIAKLAARWCMQHGAHDIAFISADGYRIGAREQLLTYARILGVPMHVANSGGELAAVLGRLGSKRLVLIDTAGMGARDLRLAEQLGAIQQGASHARVLLTLPAHSEGQTLDEIVRAFEPVVPAACILTKVDEAACLGPVLSTTLRHKLKIAYICNGQRVPEDLHAAQTKRLWLVKTALELKQRSQPGRDAAYMARHFGRAPAHA